MVLFCLARYIFSSFFSKLVKEWVEDGGHFLFFEELEPFCQNNLPRIFTMNSEYL